MNEVTNNNSQEVKSRLMRKRAIPLINEEIELGKRLQVSLDG
jgi:hypothetical protein